MKKILTSLFVGSCVVAMAQLPVSQDVEKRKVVLEEFTGKTCTFCPDGHKIAAEMKAADPENVFLINIHEGGYASGTPNYRTDFGTAIAGQTNLGGYPAGTVNRSDLDGDNATALNRGEWSGVATTIKSEDSYVNVAVDAEIDVTTNELTVNVEAYYTGNSPEASNYLNVALTQDDIWGPQTGATSFYPENVDPETGDYQHNHMLRHMLTGQWGEEITTTTQGSMIQKTYTYTLPAIIGDVDMDISKLHVVAFMTETYQSIESAGAATPSLINLPNNLEAEMISLSAPSQSCNGIVNPTFNVRNFGQQEITSLEVTYSVNSVETYTYDWTGDAILPGHNRDIEMPQVGFAVEASNDLAVEITKVNGSVDDVTTNNAAAAVIASVVEHEMTTLDIEITTDQYGSEVTWQVLDGSGAVVGSGGPYADAVSTETGSVTLPAFDCYTFELLDSYGDGLLNGGGATLSDENGTQILAIAGTDYTSKYSYNFTTVDANGEGNGNGDGSSVNPADTVVEPPVDTTGLSNLNPDNISFGLYPNPASEQLVVTFNEEVSSIEIINVLGEVLVATESKEITVRDLASGLYFVRLQDVKGNVVSNPFVKK